MKTPLAIATAVGLSLLLVGIASADKVPVYVGTNTYATQKPLAACSTNQAMNYADGGFVCSTVSMPAFAFGGYVTLGYTKSVDFAAFQTPRASTTFALHFTNTIAGTGTESGVLALYNGTTEVCTLSVTCAGVPGTSVKKACGVALTEGVTYSLRWSTTSACTSHPAGNATLTATVN